jgi:3-oxoacyl-[acyl-carrier-protein] synthase III
MRAAITAIGHYVPEKRLTNKDLEKIINTSDEWITTRTGIKERRILDKDKASSYMATKAAEKVLAQRNISADEIDLIIVGTSTPDMMLPATAAFVQRDLKASNCWGYDINAGCCGFIFALSTGAQFIETGKHNKVLIIGVEKISSFINYEDRNTCVIFGDGAGAVLLEPVEDDVNDYGVKDFTHSLNGTGAEYLTMTAGASLIPASHETIDKKMHYLYQDGKTIFKFAVTGIVKHSKEVLERNNISTEELDLFIPHQANLRIIKLVSKKLNIDDEKVVINIEKYGNTSSATIPIAMSEKYEAKEIKKGDLIVLSSFGAGFTCGSVLLRWAIN